jgi:phosphoglycerate dehydrogenase-like enzyme
VASTNIFIATPLEPRLVDVIATKLTDVDVWFEPALLPATRYPGDHRGHDAFTRDPGQQRRWQQLLMAAEVTFGVPGDDPSQLRWLVRHSHRLRLVQATAAGAGEQVEAAGLTADDLDRIAVASASGVHAGPLAEFVLLGILAFARGLPRLQQDRAAGTWSHYPTRDVAGRTALILGMGAIGARVAVLAKALGMHVLGLNSSGRRPDAPVDGYGGGDRLLEFAEKSDVLVVTLPATKETTGMVSAAVLSRLRAGAIVVNVGRGSVVDETELVRLLASGHLAGAALDVTEREPLDAQSPLWKLPNVILSPHTAALSPQENARIVDLFVENVHRLQNGDQILNRLTAATPY